jgi:pyrroloquinoline quinone biosynthesis protein A
MGTGTNVAFGTGTAAAFARATHVLLWHAVVTTNRRGGTSMQWTTPSFTDVRLGFEITMYVANR